MRLILKYLFLVLILFSNYTLIAQSGNPFEIKYRQTDTINTTIEANPFDVSQSDIQDSSKNTSLKTENISVNTTTSNNPFEVLDKPPVFIEKRNESNASTTKPIEPQPKTTVDFLFWVLLSILLFFTAIASVTRKRLEQIYGSFLNDNLLRQVHRQNQGIFSLSYFLLYLLFFLNLGLFIFLAAHKFDYTIPQTFTFLMTIWLGVSMIFLIKHLIVFLMGWIFPVEKETSLYGFTILVFSCILGIILLPMNILIAFAPTEIGKMTVYIALGAIIAIYIFRSLRSLGLASRYLMLHKFHFFLYLCAVEILPVIVLVKVILLWMD